MRKFKGFGWQGTKLEPVVLIMFNYNRNCCIVKWCVILITLFTSFLIFILDLHVLACIHISGFSIGTYIN